MSNKVRVIVGINFPLSDGSGAWHGLASLDSGEAPKPGQQHVCPVDEGLEGYEFNRKQFGLLVAKRVKDERAVL